MDYEVSSDVVVENATPRGLERFEFAKGLVKSPSEDERFVLEHQLIPQGLAKRVKPVAAKEKA